MRNLKRALSLTLASVMLLGMMVVGSSAAGYPDVSEEENIEAIEVLQAVGVMGGDENGNFNPDDYVTREQMAVIMAQLLKLDYNYYKGTNPFSDVPEWAAPYVAACAANGVTAGIGGGLYGSKQNIQAVQAALMMLKALGYFQYAGDYGDSYVLATVKQGTEIGLFDGIDSNADSALTRNQVAQMALNALKADMVYFTGDPGATIPTANGDVVIGYRPEYTSRTSTEAKYQAIEPRSSDVSADTNHRGQYYIQLGEQLYDGKLKLYDGARDPFYRPSRTWEYDGKEIGTYAKTELLKQEWSVEVTGRMLYDLLGSNVLDDNRYKVSIAIDGETTKEVLDGYGYFTKGNIVRGNTKGVGATGNGVLTEVYVDSQNYEVTIAIINTYLAVVDGDYNEKKDELGLDIYAVKDVGSNGDVVYVKHNDAGEVVPDTISGEDFDIADRKDDDIVLVTVAKGEVQTLSDPEVLADIEVTGFQRGKWLETDGTQRDYTTTALWDEAALTQYTGNYGDGSTNLKDTTYNVYLDRYGYVIGLEEIDPDDNYVFITGIDSNASNLGVRVADANAIFLDGTMQTIKVDVRESSKEVSNRGGDGVANAYGNSTAVYNAAIVNAWFTYSVSDDGTYTLRYATRQSTEDADDSNTDVYTIDKTHITRKNSDGSGYVVGNADTVYINTKSLAGVSLRKDGDTGTIIDEVDGTTVGSQNVNLKVSNSMTGGTSGTNFAPKAEIYTLYNSSNWIIGVVTINAEDEGVSSNYAYVTSGNVKYERQIDGKWNWAREVVINGEKTEIRYVSDTRIGILSAGDGDGTFVGTAAADMDMDRGFWYKINYKADGTVKSVEPLVDYFDHSEGVWDEDGDEYIDDTSEIEKTYDDADPKVALLWMVSGMNAAHTDPNRISYNEKGSVFTYAGDQTGFSISPSVKVVVCNAGGRNSTPFDSVVDGYTGESGLKKAINDLNKNNPFEGDVSAILEGGVATSIIFNCTAADPSYNGGTETEEEEEIKTGNYSSVVDETAAKATTGDPLNLNKATVVNNILSVPGVWAGGNIQKQLEDALEHLGYTIKSDAYDSDVWTWNVEKNGRTSTITCDTGAGDNVAKYYYALTVNETLTEYVASDGSSNETPKAAATGTNPTGFIKSVDGGTTWSYTAYDGTAKYASATNSADIIIKTDYYKVTGVADKTTAGTIATTTVGHYTFKSTVDNKGVKLSGGDNFAVKADATITVEFTWAATNITGTDKITVTATDSDAAAPGKDVTYAAGTWTSGAAGNVKSTAISTFTKDSTVTIAGSNTP